jgi:hypothetical protein
MPRERSSARMSTVVLAEVGRAKAKARAAGLGPVALCGLGLLTLLGVCALVVYAATTLLQMIAPVLAVMVVAVVVPPRKGVPVGMSRRPGAEVAIVGERLADPVGGQGSLPDLAARRSPHSLDCQRK